MKKAVIVGSGAGGATAAKELQGKFDVTVLESGDIFLPFTGSINTVEKLKKTGLFFDERLIQMVFPPMKIRKTDHNLVLVNGIGHGGTTTICTGNAIRKDEDLKAIGINLDSEFEELYREIPVHTDHRKKWHETTLQVYEICRNMGFDPVVTPKMAFADRCSGCGRCVLGCVSGAKWDTRHFLKAAVDKGAHLVSRCRVKKIIIENGRAKGVLAVNRMHTRFYPADLVILSAGGFATPAILENSGIECQPNLFVDPVLCLAARIPGCHQDREIPMPFIVQKEGFIISPYFDYLSYFFNRHWNHPRGDIYSLMIKMADSGSGRVSGNKVIKTLSPDDLSTLKVAEDICTEIFGRLGINRKAIFRGTINAGHPGGMLPLTENEAVTFHSPLLPDNLYVSDATLLPRSLGNPPIFTIAALSKKISKVCLKYA